MMPTPKAGRPVGEGVAARPWWEELSAHSDREEVREEITRLIRTGLATVRPRPGDPERVEVVPRDPRGAAVGP